MYNDSEAGTIKKLFNHNSYVRTDALIYWKLSEWGAYRMNGFVRFQVPGLQSEPVSCTLVYRQRNHFENQGDPLAHLHVTILAHDPKSAPDSVVYNDVANGTVIAEDDATRDDDWHRVPLNEDGIDYLWNHINGLAFLGWYYPDSTYGTGAQSNGTEAEDSRPYIIVYYR